VVIEGIGGLLEAEDTGMVGLMGRDWATILVNGCF